MIELTVDVTQELKTKRFALVRGDSFLLKGNFQDFIRFTNSWENMEEDP